MGDLAQRKTHGLAIASLVLGCFFIIPLLGFVLGLIAAILGIIALVSISNKKDTYKGNAMAITGIVLGVIGTIIMPFIALLAAIAIPNLLRARISAQESATAAAMQTIVSAEISYRAAHSSYASLNTLANEVPPYIDQQLGSGSRDGYNFSLKDFSDSGFYVVATPIENQYVGRTFYIDEKGVLCRTDSHETQSVSGRQTEGCPAGFSEVK